MVAQYKIMALEAIGAHYKIMSQEATVGTVYSYGTGSHGWHIIKLWHMKPLEAQYTLMAQEAIGAHHSCRITCERSESVRERRIALYKSDQ